jgi:mannosyltransferase
VEGSAAQPVAAGRSARLGDLRAQLAAPTWAATAVVVALTAIALIVRLAGVGQSLFGDEIFTYQIVTRNSLGGVIDAVRTTSITPPGHYVLAWLAIKIGEPHTWIRVPSIVLGTATVPLLYAVGVRTVGRPAGLVAAALLAFSPFATWYGDEARTYALLMFLIVATMYFAVRARDATGRVWPWWVAFAFAAGGSMYAHYTALFALAAIGVWAVAVCLRRGRIAEPLMAIGGGIILFLPWIPAYLDQHRNPGLQALESLSALTGRTAWEYPATMLFGQPFAPSWHALLGTAGLVLLAAAAAALVAGLVTGLAHVRAELIDHAEGLLLVALTAVATPLGLIAYSFVSSSLYLPRNLSGSLPALLLLLAAPFAWLAGRARVVAVALLIAAMALAGVQGLREQRQRPPTKEVAAAVDRLAGPDDPVLVADTLLTHDPLGRSALLDTYRTYLKKPHDTIAAINPLDPKFKQFEAMAAKHPRWVYVVPSLPGLGVRGPAGIDLKRFRIVSRTVYDSFAPITLFVLEPKAGA